MASAWSNFAYYNVGDKVVYFGGLAGQQIFTALLVNTGEAPYPPNAAWSAGVTITPPPATRESWNAFTDYVVGDDTNESDQVIYNDVVYRARQNNTGVVPSGGLIWSASQNAVDAGIARWSNFVNYKVNDVVVYSIQGTGMFQCIIPNTNDNPSVANPAWTTYNPNPPP